MTKFGIGMVSALPAYPDASQIPGIEDPEIERLASVDHEFTWAPAQAECREDSLFLGRKLCPNRGGN